MKQINLALSALILPFVLSGSALANGNWSKAEGGALTADGVEADLITLERAFIKPLFFTGKEMEPQSAGTFNNYKGLWITFRDHYETYRSSKKNWSGMFASIDNHVGEANELILEENYLAAHEELEGIRTISADLRQRNQFPNFIADDFTKFHTIMGEIIALSKTNFNAFTISELTELYEKASDAWTKVEHNDFDTEAWSLTGGEIVMKNGTFTNLEFYNFWVNAERGALNKFNVALLSGDIPSIKVAAGALKGPQAFAYLKLAGLTVFPPSMKP